MTTPTRAATSTSPPAWRSTAPEPARPSSTPRTSTGRSTSTRGNTSRVSLTLSDVTLRDGQVSGDGGGLLARESATTPTSTRSSSTRRPRPATAAASACRGGGASSDRVVSGNRRPGGRRHQRSRRLERDRRGARLDDRVQHVDIAERGRRWRAALDRDDRGRQHHGPRQHGHVQRRRPALPRLRLAGAALRDRVGQHVRQRRQRRRHRRRCPVRRHGGDLGPQLACLPTTSTGTPRRRAGLLEGAAPAR